MQTHVFIIILWQCCTTSTQILCWVAWNPDPVAAWKESIKSWKHTTEYSRDTHTHSHTLSQTSDSRCRDAAPTPEELTRILKSSCQRWHPRRVPCLLDWHTLKTHTYTPLMLCQLGCFSMPYYANDIWVTCMYATCCRPRGASPPFWGCWTPSCSRTLSPPPHPTPITPTPLSVSLSPFVKVKLCDGICLGGCGVSGMLAHYGKSVKSRGW